MTSFADIKARLKPVTVTVSICVDGEVADEIVRLQQEIDDLPDSERLGGTPERRELENTLEELFKRYDDATVPFVFRAVGEVAWARLIAGHPPREEDTRLGITFNLDSLAAPAIAHCCLSPPMTVAEVEELRAMLSRGQWNKLRNALLEANGSDGEIPKYARRSVPTADSNGSPTTAAPKASRKASS